MLESPEEKEQSMMRKHRQLLLEKQTQLQKMMESIDGILDNKFDTSMLKDFDKSKIEAAKKMYAADVKERMQQGDALYDFFHPLIQYKMKSGVAFNITSIMNQIPEIKNTDWSQFRSNGEEIAAMFLSAMKDGPGSNEAQKAVSAFQEFVSVSMPCDKPALLQIGQAYLNNKNTINKKSPGLAEFINEAIIIYCAT